MSNWMPAFFQRALARLWQSSASAVPEAEPEKPFIANGRVIYGSDLYGQIAEEERKKQLAEEAADARRIRDLPNAG